MSLLRKPSTDKKYDDYKKSGGLSDACPLCEASSIKDFANWRIIDNRFPYDKIASTHHMIIPKRHVTEADLTEADLHELAAIKSSFIAQNYEFIIEATVGVKTVPSHFHLHLIVVNRAIGE